MFRKLPIILIGIILLIGIFYPLFSPTFKEVLYSLSLTLKSLIIFILPFLIFGLLFKTSVQFTKMASKWIVLILLGICISNLISTMLSYLVGLIAYQFDLSMSLPDQSNSLIGTTYASFPKLIDNSHSMFFGLLSGILFGWIKPDLAEKMSLYLEKGIDFILKFFLYVIPLFISGFITKMIHDGLMRLILRNYSFIFFLVAGAVFTYILLIYLIANQFQIKAFGKSLKNMMPAAITGFGSMSSAAAMPLTILATEKTAKNSDLAKAIIPTTVNVHLIGDCFAIPIFAFAIMKSFGVASPEFSSYFLFALYFVLAKFSVAAVPGGGILVMLPILETHLGFNGEMLSLITALYILFDPFITSANVLGNGGFALGLGNLFEKKLEIASN